MFEYGCPQLNLSLDARIFIANELEFWHRYNFPCQIKNGIIHHGIWLLNIKDFSLNNL